MLSCPGIFQVARPTPRAGQSNAEQKTPGPRLSPQKDAGGSVPGFLTLRTQIGVTNVGGPDHEHLLTLLHKPIVDLKRKNELHGARSDESHLQSQLLSGVHISLDSSSRKD